MISSPLKWVGGKYSILDKILPQLKTHNRFVEPFMGSCVVSLNVEAKEYILNDYNPDLVNFFTYVMSRPNDIILYDKPYFEDMNSEKYYDVREKFNTLSKTSFERASLFLVLNKFAFNGVCRYNRYGMFNVPYSKKTSISIPNLSDVSHRFRNKIVKFHNLDFSNDILYNNLEENDVVYFDPPYLPSDDFDTTFSDYTGDDFTYEQHVKIVEISEKLRDKGVKCIISNHDTKQIRDLYKNSNSIITFPIRRNVASKKEKRKVINELLAIYGNIEKSNVLFED
jgi:DNA adenine methylase